MDNHLHRARDIILRQGWNAVSYQILNPGFTLWFSPTRPAVAGYVRAGNYYVVAGAPVCASNDLTHVVEELEAEASRHGCRVCYFGASTRLYEGRHNPPQHSVAYLGAQPIWDPTLWDNMVGSRPSVRAQFFRATNKGVTVSEWVEPAPANVALLRSVLAAWLASRPMPPMHFLVEPDTLSLLRDRRLFVATQARQCCGFLVASPIPARGGWLIEQIIRHPAAPNGTNELLLNEAVRSFAREGSRYMTLGLVPLSRRPSSYQGNSLWLNVLFGWGRAHGKRFYNFEGLEAFKGKFCPADWEPIFAISTEARFSLRTLWAIAAVFSENQSPLRHARNTLTKTLRVEAKNLARTLSRRR